MRSFTLVCLVLVLSLWTINLSGQSTIAMWDFGDEAKRGLIPGGGDISLYTPDEGAGTIDLIGPQFTGWVVGSGGSGTFAPNSNGWDDGALQKAWEIHFSTIGYKEITVSSMQQSSATGPRDFVLVASTDGITWEEIYQYQVANNFIIGVLDEIALPQEFDNQEDVYLRWMIESTTSVNAGTVGPNGTNRIDQIIIAGKCDVGLQMLVNELPVGEGEELHFCKGTEITIKVDDIIHGGESLDITVQLNEEPPIVLTEIEGGEILFDGVLETGIYEYKLISIAGEFCEAHDPEGLAVFTIIMKDDPVVSFTLNNNEIYEGFELITCYNENVSFSFYEITEGELPITVSWLFNGDSEHILSGNDVVIDSEHMELWAEILEPGENHISFTSIVDALGCEVTDFSEYHAIINVKSEPAVLFAINQVEIHEGHIAHLCPSEHVAVSFQEAINGDYPFTISWTVNGDPEHELSGHEVEINAENQDMFSGYLEPGEYLIEITSIIDGNNCEVEDVSPYNAIINIFDEPAVLFSINDVEIHEGHIENLCVSDHVAVNFHQAIAGEYPFTISWTVNDDPEHEFSGYEVEINEENQELFAGYLETGEYVIQITSVIDGNGCEVMDVAVYNASINVYQEPAVLFSINNVEIYEAYELEICGGDFVEVKFHEAVSGEYPFLISWTVNGDTEHELSGTDVEVAEAGQILFEGFLGHGEYLIEITSIIDAHNCEVTDVSAYYATIHAKPEPAVLFSINGTEMYEGFEKYICSDQYVHVNFHEALAGYYPFIISWTINGDPGHELSGNNVEITEENQELFAGQLELGDYLIEITSIVDANECHVSDLSVYNAMIHVMMEPEVMFSVNDHEITDGFEIDFCASEHISIKFHEAISGDYPFIISWKVNGNIEHEYSAQGVKVFNEDQVIFTNFLESGQYVIQITEIADANGCSVSDLTPYNAILNIIPEFSHLQQIPTIPLCFGTSESNALNLLPSEVNVYDTEGEVYVVNASWSIANYDSETTGNYTATGNLVLPAELCAAQHELEISVILNNMMNYAINLGSDINACLGEEVILMSPAADSYTWYNGSTEQSIVVTETGYYSVEVNQGTCYGADTIKVTFHDPPAEFSLGNDMSACIGDSYVIQGPSASQYLWNTGATTQNIEVSVTGIYELTIFNLHGCSRTADVFVKFDEYLSMTLHDEDTLFSCVGDIVELNSGVLADEYLWTWGEENSSTDAILEVTENGWYFITVTADACVGDNDSVYVFFNDLPVFNLGDDLEFCDEKTEDISAPAGYDYLWNTGETTQEITVSQEGTYSCTIIDQNGCKYTDSVVVTVFDLPMVDLGGDLVIDQDQVIMLSVEAGHVSYLWSTGETGNLIYIVGADYEIGEHVISVTVTSQNGCYATNQIILTVVEGLFVDQQQENKVNIFPNPATDKIYVQIDNFDNDQILSIININGQTVAEINVQNSVTEIDVSEFASGSYLIVISSREKRSVSKIIIE